MRNIDFSSWQSLLVTLVGLTLVTIITLGIRLLIMFTIQQRRETMNRQINERLRTLIAAYKTLGGSFTGDLSVDPAHLRDLHRHAPLVESDGAAVADMTVSALSGSDRKRRTRDAVEAALSDIILLGTEEHVRLAVRAAGDMVAGHTVHTHDLVVSLRNFIRQALDLDPIPSDLVVHMQGPARLSTSASRGKGDREKEGSGRGGGNGMGGGGGGTGIGGDDKTEISLEQQSNATTHEKPY